HERSPEKARTVPNPADRRRDAIVGQHRQRRRNPRLCRRRELQVILVDVNILVYAAISKFSQHQAAKKWLEDQLNGPAPVGLPWMSLLGYLRLVTNSRIFKPPVPMTIAWQCAAAWLSGMTVWI